MKNLLEKSDIYYKKAAIYETFAQAEDAPNLLYETLLPIFKDKNILDIGCGTGKYLRLFSPHVKSIVGVDAADNQLSFAKEKIKDLKNVELISSDIADLSLSKSYDIVFASWVLGTITDEQKRFKILNNIKSFLVPNGKIFLAENDLGGEFEYIRGRINDPQKRTESYNNWLQEQGFKVEYKLDTYFEFLTDKIAKDVIKTIWGEKASSKVLNKKIGHKIIVYSLC